MSLLSESLTIGLLLTLVFGALFFYLYSRVTYAEKRVGLMENILIDIKMKEEQHHMHLPNVPSHMTFNDAASNSINVPFNMPPVAEEHNVPQEIQVEELATPVEELQDKELYSEVLDNVEVLEEKTQKTDVGVNYEAMTKEELIEIAKKKGLRVSNRPGREKLLQIIRQSEGLVSENVVEVDN